MEESPSSTKMKTEILAMILAGGKGSRLGKLTQKIAKPAVPFGGRYRIIDFTLSNCINSGINNVGVVTQYQPLALNNHIGNGSSWGFDGLNAGVTILQPYSSNDGIFTNDRSCNLNILSNCCSWHDHTINNFGPIFDLNIIG